MVSAKCPEVVVTKSNSFFLEHKGFQSKLLDLYIVPEKMTQNHSVQLNNIQVTI